MGPLEPGLRGLPLLAVVLEAHLVEPVGLPVGVLGLPGVDLLLELLLVQPELLGPLLPGEVELLAAPEEVPDLRPDVGRGEPVLGEGLGHVLAELELPPQPLPLLVHHHLPHVRGFDRGAHDPALAVELVQGVAVLPGRVRDVPVDDIEALLHQPGVVPGG